MTCVYYLSTSAEVIGFADEGNIRFPNYIATWNDACKLLAHRIIKTPPGEYSIRVDWKPLADKIVENLQTEILSLNRNTYVDQDSPANLWEKVEVPIEVSFIDKLTKNNDESQMKFGRFIAERFLYDCFLTMNLASPGCCNFDNSHIHDANLQHENEIDATALPFENAWIDSLKNSWPIINSISLHDVLSWFDTLDIGIHQIARNRMERGIFSLLQVCAIANYNKPEILIWIAHGLETIFDSPQNKISHTLQDRICEVLEAPPQKETSIRKQIRNFYDLRSKFAHGEMDVSHPTKNDLLDKRFGEYQSAIMGSADFGTSILVAVIQKHIINHWRQIDFREIHEGIPL